MASVGIVFVIIYYAVGNYSDAQGEGFGFNQEHIIAIMKMFCVLNFNWVLILLSLGLVLHLFISNKITTIQRKFIILASSASGMFLALNCFIESYLNPRYTDFFYPCILVMSMVLLMIVSDSRVWNAISTVVMGIFFCLIDFKSIDPISDKLFSKTNVGENFVYSTGDNFHFYDGSVYNRQYYSFDIVMNKALSVAYKNRDDIIAISVGDETTSWQMSGKWDMGRDEFEFEEFWDINKSSRAPGYKWDYYDDSRYDVIKIRYIYSHHNTIEALSEGKSFIYIYMPSLNGGREDLVRSKYKIIEEGMCEFRGWKVAYMRGAIY